MNITVYRGIMNNGLPAIAFSNGVIMNIYIESSEQPKSDDWWEGYFMAKGWADYEEWGAKKILGHDFRPVSMQDFRQYEAVRVIQ